MVDEAIPAKPLQEWEGHVVSVAEAAFVARLVDLTAGEGIETEEAEIPLDNVPGADRELVGVGAVFRWTISAAGSIFAFRREPTWTEDDLHEARERAQELSAGIKWD